MGEGDYQYTSDVTKIYHTDYVRNSRAVAVLWAIFTICTALLNIASFIQPQWLGDTGDSDRAGYFGLYQYCVLTESGGGDATCTGSFTDFNSILNSYFQTAAFFVGASALLFLICVLCMLCFFFLNTVTVLRICGWLQAIAGVFMFLGCVIYPSGWGSTEVREVCGFETTGRYKAGSCELRWAYILAIVVIFDALILATLAFVMAAKQANLLPEVYAKLEKPDVNGYYPSDTLSKRSAGPPLSDDRYSEYSHRSEKSKRSTHSLRAI